MTNIHHDNLQVERYGSIDYIANIINRGKSKRSIVCGVFTIHEIRQWKEAIKAFERDIKEL